MMRAQDYSVVTVLALVIDSVSVNGHRYNIETELFEQASTGNGKRTDGMMVGGRCHRRIGWRRQGSSHRCVGRSRAGVVRASTGNRDITLPAESALSFRLVQPLTLKPE
jgi:hypothetical protein